MAAKVSDKITTLVLFSIILFAAPCWSGENVHRELIVKFIDPVINISPDVKSAGKEAIVMMDHPIGRILMNSNIVQIQRAFENYNPIDSLVIDQFGNKILRPRLDNYYTITFEESESRDDTYRKLVKEGGIISIVRNGIYSTDDAEIDKTNVEFTFDNDKSTQNPNDPLYDDQWNLQHDSLFGVNAAGAWKYTTGDSDIIIAIVDYPIKGDHPDLYPRVFGDTGSGYPHGTFIAGIAAANSDNEICIAGMCWKSRIMSMGVVNWDAEDLYPLIIEAVDSGAAVVSCSWGGNDSTLDTAGWYDMALRQSMAYSYKLNRVTVCSKGNYNTDALHYPSDFEYGIISVGGSDSSGNRWYDSNFGNGMDVLAPATRLCLLSAYPDLCGYFFPISGTSFAVPHVSGLSALLFSYDDDIYNDDIENIINNTAVDMGATGYDDTTGYGRLNAGAAFEIQRLPNHVRRWYDENGSVYSSEHIDSMWFVDIPNLSDTTYYQADKYCVRKTVTFPDSCYDIPYVWGRGIDGDADTLGYNDEFLNCGMGYTSVVSGTATNSGCELETYVYYILTPDGDSIGWFPCTPANVDFAYTVIGTVLCDPVECGDANNDCNVDLLDITYLTKYVYNNGPAPVPPESGDVNCSSSVDLLDITYLINYLYKSGSSPDCPPCDK